MRITPNRYTKGCVTKDPSTTSSITLAHAFEQGFSRHLPVVTGTVERVVLAAGGEPWQLLRLEQPLALAGGTCGFLLLRVHRTEAGEDGATVFTFDVLRATPEMRDGFDPAIFERLGRARTHPPAHLSHAPVPPSKPSWRKIGIATGVVVIAGMVIWRFWDSPHFPTKLVVRIALELLGGLK